VLLAVSKAAGRSYAGISHLAIGFQGGLMAGEVCGAASGAALAIGLLYGEDQAEAVPHLTEQFMHRFAARNGAVRCIDIIGFNIGSANSEFEIGSLKDLFLFLTRGGKRACNGVVSNAVQALLEVLNDWES
jgi:C_GCAxxG_C_C family probable redox protein